MSLLPQFLADSLLLGALYALLSIGMSLGFGVTRIINFAHGEFVMLGAYAAYFMFTVFGLDPLLALPIVAIGGLGLGVLVFVICVRKILRAPAINQILLTFGIGLVLQNAALMAFSGDLRATQPPYALESLELGSAIIPTGSLLAAGVALLAYVLLFLWLDRTETGRASQAIAENETAARLMGIDVGRVYGLAFALSAALAAGSGAVVSFLLSISPFMGVQVVIKVFAIIILGGMGSIIGAALGSMILALVETWVAYYVPDGSGWAEGVAFAVLLAMLLLRPRGLISQTLAG